MFTSLTVGVRQGYEQVAGSLDVQAQTLVAAARKRRSVERGRALMAIVLAYREGPRELWGPILLDLLAPALLARLRRLRSEPPVMDDEDIRQQLVMELLRAAAGMPLPDQPSYLRSRLMARTNQAVRRWLQRERRRQSRQHSFEAHAETAIASASGQRPETHDQGNGKSLEGKLEIGDRQ
ncbi:MAG TPA: hypothetical protein VHW91_01165 [Candidatus Dormibacteraeota bacterium]|nr:hypothetical protein [Candidatus Dormibacteraeota bacterium]